MKEATKKKQQEWIRNGHGKYSDLGSEKGFFEMTKKSQNFVCHFYASGNEHCKLVDKHLRILAPRHLEARFCKVNAARAPFLTRRLRMEVLPTVVLVKDSRTRDFIVGLSELGDRADFATEAMERRIALSGTIDKQPSNGKSASNGNGNGNGKPKSNLKRPRKSKRGHSG
nr:thioredoxin domain-containing protein 9-like [Drosophila takahashii]